MSSIFEKRIAQLVSRDDPQILWGGRKGIEKEALRVSRNGELSQRPHPASLGSALTNRFITTDFSESLLEFVTPAFTHNWETLRFLCDIHQFAYDKLDDELLWVASMPCCLQSDADVPLAQYGSSNLGRMKTLYRNGLGLRYGRLMQTIAGVHFNYSVPEQFWQFHHEICETGGDSASCRSEAYLGLIRNFRRMGWLVLYLFGSSPAVDRCFAGTAGTGIAELDKDTLYEPYGTSLRMSDLGYSNKTQSRVNISLNFLDEYIADLRKAIHTPVRQYEEIGVKVDGEYRQLNANLLQIENEYYSPVRPKRVIVPGEKPTEALERAGIEYVEIRSLDVNIFDPVGISQNELRFMEAFLLYCLLEDSPFFTDDEFAQVVANHGVVARQGRTPGLRLQRGDQDVSLQDWALEIFSKVAVVAELIDKGDGDTNFAQAVTAFEVLARNPDATPSARLLQELRDSRSSFKQFALQTARGHRDYFKSLVPVDAERLAQFERETATSLHAQHKIEAADSVGFDEFLAEYFK